MTAKPILYERAGVDGLCPSPVCWRTRIALALKGVEAERRPLRFADVESRVVGMGPGVPDPNCKGEFVR